MPSFLAAVAGTIALLAAPADSSRITAASNVRLRAAPSDAADVVATVPIGTLLQELETGGADDGWVRLRAEDGRDGWTPASLTRRVDAGTRVAVVDRLIGERLGRRGDGFAARADVVALVERTATEVAGDRELAARFALHWARAVAGALEVIPPSQVRVEPYASWIAARKDALVFHRPTGRWSLGRDAILALEARHHGTAAADDLAWFAVLNGVPGNCDTFLPCAVRRRNDLEGEYLRRAPAGVHAAEAVTRVAEVAQRWTGADMIFDPRKDCAELRASLTPLQAAAAGVPQGGGARVAPLLDAAGRRCTAR